MTSHWMDRIAGLTTHIQARCSIQALGSPRTSIKLPDLSIYKLEPFIVQLRLRIGYLEEHQIFGVEYSFIMSDPHHIIVLITSKILGIRSDQSKTLETECSYRWSLIMPNGKFSHDAKRAQLHKWTQCRKDAQSNRWAQSFEGSAIVQ